MEAEVRGAMGGAPCGAALSTLLEMTVVSITENRPIFENVADEPVFYRRHFYKWVKAIIDEEKAIQQSNAGAMRAIGL